MADRENLARYLRVSQALLPNDPEAEADAKRTMVNIAGLKRQARETGHGADTGRRPQDRAELRRKTHRIRDAASAT